MAKQSKHDAKEISFEVSLARMQEIVTSLERGDIPLDEGLQLYREGMLCARQCRDALEKARHEITVWQNGSDESFEQAQDTSQNGVGSNVF